jgi:hypothetical protein
MAAARAPRLDPVARPLVHMAGAGDVDGKDPTKAYVWANCSIKDGAPGSVEWYEELGYEPVLSNGREKLRGKRKDGTSQLKLGGCLLMSVDKATKQQIEEEGVDGLGGLRHLRQLKAAILDPRMLNNPLGGISSQHARIINETQPETLGAFDG